MRYSPLVFLGALFAMAASWTGFVLVPQLQLGEQQQETNAVKSAVLYPQERPGLARQGLQVYRANGCAACHTQEVGQDGIEANVVLTDGGTNLAALTEALLKVNADLSTARASSLTSGLPRLVLRGVTAKAAQAAVKAVQSSGAAAKIQLAPTGPDITRGWGPRRNVAADYLFDRPVMLGQQRVGPDLANVGLRLPDANWQLRHLYNPRIEVKDSPMPPYRFLFEKRKIGQWPSPDALKLPGSMAPPAGYEIVPRPEAVALVAYLQSLHSDTPLFEAPMSAPITGLASTRTNSTAQ